MQGSRLRLDRGGSYNHIELALSHLRNYIWMEIHPDLEGLRGDPEFLALLDRHLN